MRRWSRRWNRVIRACNEMGGRTLIEVIHDQGAGGPANVLKELVEHSGGRIEIRKIRVGDPTMSVLEIYVAEYQERNGLLIRPENIEQFLAICEREKVACEVLGEVTGDLRFVVSDEQDGSTPVDVELKEVLGHIPQKTFEDSRVPVGAPCIILGTTTAAEKHIRIHCNGELVLDEDMRVLRQEWEETSYQLERLQVHPACAEEERRNIYDRTAPAYHLPFTPQPSPKHLLTTASKPKVAILRDEGSNSDREMSSAFHAAGFEPWDITMTDLLAGRVTLDGFRGIAAVGGFSYADVPESAKGWAATILFNERLRTMFDAFLDRPDTFTLGICNGCQLFGLLGWVPWRGLDAAKQPRFVHNTSGRFESRWTTVRVTDSPAMMLRGMSGLVFGIHVAHGEGLLHFPDAAVRAEVIGQRLVPLVYADDSGAVTEQYPFNPNGSPDGFAGLCSPDGRHLALMPHPERAFLPWQCHWLPREMQGLEVSPWLRMFQNAREWCRR
ncbi:phosphoribosylformylglycinamidine synthase subunit PurQ, partial [Candidatus Electronema sp. JC]|uniref:phosphoribosylformylglycinamidine synthase subunit PurQ n=1 Tax=Candidatus Electronema sp. JC TaxID=3401570 RepID=UPI003B42D8DA